LPGQDHLVWLSDADVVLGEIEEFLTGVRHTVEPDRVLATCSSPTSLARQKKRLRSATVGGGTFSMGHNVLVRRELARFRGREVKTAGDGFFAAFDGPARAVRCACSVSRGIQSLGLEVRAGIHTGECEIIGDDMGGMHPRAWDTLARKATTGESCHRFGGPPEMPAQMTASV
jgi:hypothetical protein